MQGSFYPLIINVNYWALTEVAYITSQKQTILSKPSKNHIIKVFERIPIYGEKKVHQQFKVSLNTVARYRRPLLKGSIGS
ncbi:hypothetical protein MS2017_1333 [Bathymodiolus thermophilus thioautotrophic gill symbiont]|uniref:Uncharacterized protein n=1 Tax=Bathymodiolus thermophilus thioautotrophic gill symbiont TaxID=2360 RepID=A0A3G3IMG6_9GAMM|nr:hypothetical protein [Bathymodiolus thermophilus thioautotrophic gill symbiont]AYQ57023.1 hypothetical protein MS2017_1333 [Bathymodiolus thermophilus thioautotrophic gill symbiont]